MPSSVFIVLQRGHEICFFQRANTGWLDGYYSIAAGGVEEHETLLEAAVREAKEELGIAIDVQHLQLVHTVHCLTDGDEWLGHFFAVTRWTGEPRINEPDKHDNLVWATLVEPPTP